MALVLRRRLMAGSPTASSVFDQAEVKIQIASRRPEEPAGSDLMPGCRRPGSGGPSSLARSAYTLERATLHVSHTIVSG